MSRVRELTRLRKYAEWAAIPLDSQSAQEDADKHWKGHAYMVKWMKSNPVAIADICIAVARWDLHPGGLANRNVKLALAELPEVREEDAV